MLLLVSEMKFLKSLAVRSGSNHCVVEKYFTRLIRPRPTDKSEFLTITNIQYSCLIKDSNPAPIDRISQLNERINRSGVIVSIYHMTDCSTSIIK